MLHALEMTYLSKKIQVWSKGPCTGTIHVGLWFGVHRERAKGHTIHVLAIQLSQCWKDIDHREEVIEVPECDGIDVEVLDGCECREKAWEARMKRDVLQELGSFRTRRPTRPSTASRDTLYKEFSKIWKLPVEDSREQRERICSGVEGDSDE